MSVQITLLGVGSVTRDGAPVALDTRKALALIAHLALCDRPRSREALCALLWPAHDPSRARGALRRTLSTVRGAVGEHHVATDGDGVELRRGRGLEIDVDRFRDLAGDDATADELEAAVALFAGDLLEGFSLRDCVEFDDWHSTGVDLLNRELGSALRRLVAARSARRECEQALPHARRWLRLDPLHEPAHRELIRLRALTGDRAGALEQYRECVRTLSRELGVAPLQETADLYEQVNDGRVAVVATPAFTPASPTARPESAGVAPASPTAEPASAAAPVAPLTTALPLVGRDRELATLMGAHEKARPDGCLAVIEGEAGIGKTRLCEELALRARAAGAVVLTARCHD
ncbi:MAG: BTAD domain-containing putative transcriptional regulator, partial [Solirubrobacteraceae bacterium]